MKHDFNIADWEQAKAEAKQLLSQRAKLRGMMTYSELTGHIKAIRLEPHSRSLPIFLDEISEEEDIAGRGLLTVIVVHKIGDMQPGPGFFEMAKRRGRDTTDTVKCWVEESKKVHRAWSR